MKTYAIGMSLIGLLVSQQAAADSVLNASIVSVYTQSRIESTAHLIKIDQALPTACDSNRAYIDINDNELWAAALSNFLAGTKINLIYTTTAAPATAAGHIGGTTCKVVSIYQ